MEQLTVFGVLRVSETKEYRNIELFFHSSAAKEFARREELEHPDDLIEVIKLAISSKVYVNGKHV